MTAIKTIKADTTTVAKIDGRKYGHAPIAATPWVSEVGKPEVGDGIIGIDSDFAADIQHVRGWAARLTIVDPPAFDRLQAQQVRIKARCVYGGIITETSDINLDSPRICSFRDTGVWAKGGSTWIRGGHIYGGDTAIRIGGDGSISGKCGMVGVQANDSRVGVEILHPLVATNCETKQCWNRGVIVGAKSRLENYCIGAYASNNGDSTGYVGLEFAVRDRYYGHWSSYTGSVIVGDGATGIICDSEFTTIDADFEGRGPNATSLLLGQYHAPGACTINVRQSGCGKGVVMLQLGWHNRINIWGMQPLYTLPAQGWSKRNNEIRFNGTLIEDK